VLPVPVTWQLPPFKQGLVEQALEIQIIKADSSVKIKAKYVFVG